MGLQQYAQCVGCHQTDYDGANDPDHSAAGFSTDCATCHSETAWDTFDHDNLYFPIYSGEHDGEWSDCVDCHTNPNNFAEFTCTSCHTNPETDNEHTGVGGYTYESTACLACHPTGDSDTAFDHDNTNFPLTNTLAWRVWTVMQMDLQELPRHVWIVTKWILMGQ
ncbi:MAG: cytochrome c3 family protein [Chitinophagales bacterium]